jgi:hypothetical protein
MVPLNDIRWTAKILHKSPAASKLPYRSVGVASVPSGSCEGIDTAELLRIGRTETQKTLVSLAQLVREALTEVREDTEGRNIAWKIGALPDFYGTVQC